MVTVCDLCTTKYVSPADNPFAPTCAEGEFLVRRTVGDLFNVDFFFGLVEKFVRPLKSNFQTIQLELL